MQGGTRFPPSKMDLAGLLSRVMGLLRILKEKPLIRSCQDSSTPCYPTFPRVYVARHEPQLGSQGRCERVWDTSHDHVFMKGDLALLKTLRY